MTLRASLLVHLTRTPTKRCGVLHEVSSPKQCLCGTPKKLPFNTMFTVPLFRPSRLDRLKAIHSVYPLHPAYFGLRKPPFIPLLPRNTLKRLSLEIQVAVCPIGPRIANLPWNRGRWHTLTPPFPSLWLMPVSLRSFTAMTLLPSLPLSVTYPVPS